MENKDYIWTDNPTVSGVSTCDTDILNECLMHLKYNNSNGLPLFFMLTTDRALTGDEGLGWALQGSYVTMTYPDAVNMIISEYNSGVSVTYRGISCKRSAGGRYIADISKKEDVDELYTTSGIADIYVVDRTNKAFYLPKTKWFYQYTNDLNNVNKYNEPGLPNHQHSPIYLTGSNADLGDPGTCYMTNNSQQNGVQTSTNSRTGNVSNNNLYGKSSTVQPPSSNKFIYYKVGDVVAGATSALIDAQEYFSDAMQSLEEKTADGLAALSDASTALTRVQITNCILEAPENIKYTLNNGVLTIKAGSVITIPDGFNTNGSKKFRYVEIENDVTGSTEANDVKRLIYYNETTGSIMSMQYSESGTTDYSGTGNCLLYRTDLNKTVVFYGGNKSEHVVSLPLMEINGDVGAVVSINSVFNTCGYMGSSLFVNKGLKFLIPNRRNSDGTLNNIEAEFTDVGVYTVTDNVTGEYWVQAGGSNFVGRLLKTWWKYDLVNNYIVGGNGEIARSAMVGEFSISSGKITSFKPYNTFHAVDYNEANNKANRDFSNVTKPYVKQSYINGTSWYRVWSDGWIEQGGRGYAHDSQTHTVTFLKTFANANYTLEVQMLMLGTAGNISDNTIITAMTANSYAVTGSNVGPAGGWECTTSWYACGF